MKKTESVFKNLFFAHQKGKSTKSRSKKKKKVFKNYLQIRKKVV